MGAVEAKYMFHIDNNYILVNKCLQKVKIMTDTTLEQRLDYNQLTVLDCFTMQMKGNYGGWTYNDRNTKRLRQQLTTDFMDQKGSALCVRLERDMMHVMGENVKWNGVDYYDITARRSDGMIERGDKFLGPYRAQEIYTSIPITLFNLCTLGLFYFTNPRVQKMDKFLQKLESFKQQNQKEILKMADQIPVYQLSLSDTKAELAKQGIKDLTLVPMGSNNQFLSGINLRELRFNALCVGADALVAYQPGSAYATPVKYVR